MDWLVVCWILILILDFKTFFDDMKQPKDAPCSYAQIAIRNCKICLDNIMIIFILLTE